MIKGLYTAASSMLASKKNMEITSNNLANADTDAFKKQGVVQKSFSEMLISKIENGKNTGEIGKLGTGVSLSNSYTDFSAGDYQYTGNKLDLAIKGEGFFVIETSAGEKYTRNGNFTINREGKIVTQDGDYLLDEDGRHIQTLPDRELRIDGYGELHFEDLKGSKIQIVDFTDHNVLARGGNNNYRIKEDINGDINNFREDADDYQVVEGYLEKSNVNVVEEMVNMIEVTRNYESNQKVIQTMDNTLDKAVNEVGRIA